VSNRGDYKADNKGSLSQCKQQSKSVVRRATKREDKGRVTRKVSTQILQRYINPSLTTPTSKVHDFLPRYSHGSPGTNQSLCKQPTCYPKPNGKRSKQYPYLLPANAATPRYQPYSAMDPSTTTTSRLYNPDTS